MAPVIRNRANAAIKALVLHPSKRQGDFENLPDEDLRAMIREAEWMLSAWSNEVRIFDHNRARDELERQDEANPQ